MKEEELFELAKKFGDEFTYGKIIETLKEKFLDKAEVKKVVENPIVNQIVMKRTTESWEEFRTRCYEAERERIKEELGLE